MNYQELDQKTQQLVDNGNNEEAINLALNLCHKTPNDGQIWLILSKLYFKSNNINKAFDCCRKSLQLLPESIEINYNLAVLYYTTENYDEVIKICKNIIKNEPNFIDALALLGGTLSFKSQFEEAEKHLTKCTRIAPDNGDFFLHLADTQLITGQINTAISTYKKAHKILGDRLDVITSLADAYERNGDHKNASKIIIDIFEQEPDNFNVAISFSKICKYINRQEDAIDRLITLSTSSKLRDSEIRKIHFALGKLFDKQHKYTEAFTHYEKGNQLKSAKFDSYQDGKTADIIINTFSSTALANLPASKKGNKKDIRPIFIIGLPRSGTSLVEQIMASHPDVYAAGEYSGVFDIVSDLQQQTHSQLNYPACLQQYTSSQMNELSKQYFKPIKKLSPDNARVVTDKTPLNYIHLGLIQLLFPKARIINCVRNPVDICLSCYFQDFYSHQPFTYDLKHLASFYKNYIKLMSHWKNTLKLPIFDVSYEKLVTQPEKEIRSLLDFTGLKWNNKCLDFHKNKRHVATASYDQVRQPIYTSSLNRWKNYESSIPELLDSLKTV